MILPLVWVVLPTQGARLQYLGRALANWKRQTYRNLRVLVLDGGGSAGPDARVLEAVMAANDPRFLYASVPPMPLGEKYNAGCHMAPDGAILAFSGDDDWNHPERIARTVAAMDAADVQVAGSMSMLAYRMRDQAAYHYRHPRVIELVEEHDDGGITTDHTTPYMVHGTMLVAKHHWERCQFPSLQRASDSLWTREMLALSVPGNERAEMEAELAEDAARVTMRYEGRELAFLQLDAPESYVAWVHGANTGNPLDGTGGVYFTPWAPGRAGIANLLGPDAEAFGLAPAST